MAAENVDHPEYLLRLAGLELIHRHQRMVERRIRAARFPLRTLQRRVKDWRGFMAKKLVYAASDEPASERSEKVDLVLVALGNKG